MQGYIFYTCSGDILYPYRDMSSRLGGTYIPGKHCNTGPVQLYKYDNTHTCMRSHCLTNVGLAQARSHCTEPTIITGNFYYTFTVHKQNFSPSLDLSDEHQAQIPLLSQLHMLCSDPF